jgi:hypothetical protein
MYVRGYLQGSENGRVVTIGHLSTHINPRLWLGMIPMPIWKLSYINLYYIYIFIWKNYPFTTGATTTVVAVAASKICLHIIKLYTVHTKNNIYSEMSHNFSLKCLSFC